MTTQAPLPAYGGPANWKGLDITDSDEWHFHLTETHIGEIKGAVQKSMDDGIDTKER